MTVERKTKRRRSRSEARCLRSRHGFEPAWLMWCRETSLVPTG